MKIAQILRYALICAKQDRQSLIDAYDGDVTQKVVVEAQDDIKRFDLLLDKYFGGKETKLMKLLNSGRSVSIFKAISEEIDITTLQVGAENKSDKENM